MEDSELRALLERHHQAGFGWALRCCARDPSRAEDVLQTTYLKILDGRARFDGRAEFKTWLFAVIRRTAADDWRRSLLRAFRLVAYDPHESSPRPETGPEAMNRDESRSALLDALRSLPKRQQEVLHLVFYEEMSIEQASEAMGVSVGSGRTHYERGKQRLREIVKHVEVFNEARARG